MTADEMGAEPVIMTRTRPPSKARSCTHDDAHAPWLSGRLAGGGSNAAATHLAKYQLVPQLVLREAVLEVVRLGGQGIVEQELLETTSHGHSLHRQPNSPYERGGLHDRNTAAKPRTQLYLHEFVVDTVEQAGDAGEHGGLQHSQILEQLRHIALVEPDSTSLRTTPSTPQRATVRTPPHDEGQVAYIVIQRGLNDTLEHVGQWQLHNTNHSQRQRHTTRQPTRQPAHGVRRTGARRSASTRHRRCSPLPAKLRSFGW